MPARRARAGRGWDASPPRQDRHDSTDERSGRGAIAGRAGAKRAGIRRAGAKRAGTNGTDERSEARDPYEVAREICLRALSIRPRTRAELATELRKRGMDAEVATAVLDRYDEVGLIDDAAFARAWVSSRHHGRGLARRALASELRQRGVDSGTVDAALGTLDGDTEAATARSLVERRLRGMGSASSEAAFRRLVSMLARKGYPAGLAIGVVKDALADRESTSASVTHLDVDDMAVAQLDEEAAAQFEGD